MGARDGVLMVDASLSFWGQREGAFVAHGAQSFVIETGKGLTHTIVVVDVTQEHPEHCRLHLVEA